MKFSYNKLWKLLIDKDWTKTKLRQEAGISSSTIAKLGKGENITTDILLDFLRNKIWYNSSMNYEASKQLTDV
ncbi:helix-turn-helix domain-containing protein, partial [Streptococcus agalactiae]|uniref:helix-turn-helix domain-containing protein n=1 Tax=Streptococcus agalactiae TaxID=1311 RepID=UPI003CC6065E